MNHRPIRIVTGVVAATASLVLAVAQPAFASITVTSNMLGVVHLESDADSDFIVVSCIGGFISPVAAPPIACGDVTLFEGVLGNSSDSLDLGSVGPATFPHMTETTADLRDSDSLADSFTGSQLRDVVTASAQDTVVGGPGDDLITGAGTASGGEGDDVIVGSRSAQGGAGDDRIVNLDGIGPYDGGAGYDRAVIDDSTGDLSGVLLLADTYTDTSTEIRATVGSSTVDGTAATTGFEQMTIDLPNGVSGLHYVLDGSAFSGRSVITTGNGNDTVRTGPGADDVQSGAGNDTVDPGTGPDVVRTGAGDDTITTRDGSSDIVDCGSGTDTVTADAVDVVTSCETVSLPAPETGKVAGAKKVTQGAKATFTFSSPSAGATFECQLDKGAFKACSSPFKVATKKLRPGKHTLLVRAVLPGGTVDASPTAHTFKVQPKKK